MLEMFFPKSCPVCKSLASKTLCQNCTSDLVPLDEIDSCRKCGEPFSHIERHSGEESLCIRCINDEFHFDTARSVFIHKGIIKDLLHKFKYRKKIILSKTLSELTITRFPYKVSSFDTVIPVPLYIKKLREREYNQSSLIAKRVAACFGCNFDPFSLVKTKRSKPQFEMGNLGQRIKNVKNLFEVKEKNSVAGEKVLLIDDVYTTGATINECSKVLFAAGAKKVDVLTLTRATFNFG